MELIIASNNAHKVKEIKEILGDFFDGVFSMKEVGVDVDVGVGIGVAVGVSVDVGVTVGVAVTSVAGVVITISPSAFLLVTAESPQADTSIISIHNNITEIIFFIFIAVLPFIIMLIRCLIRIIIMTSIVVNMIL